MKNVITDDAALYLGDCLDIMPSFPDGSVHLTVYSPPFCGLYHYSSSERDMSNCRSRDEFMEHYRFLVHEIARVTMAGRISAVHCMDVPVGDGVLFDFPGEIIRLHEQAGMLYIGRHSVWKPPLAVRMRTMARGLAHIQVCDDASLCDMAGADSLLIFRKRGANPVPIVHPTGLLHYSGARRPPADVLPFRGWTGHQTENRYSHWVWRQYASAFWDDVRIDRVLPFRESREEDDEKHVHPLQLDVIDRIVMLRSNEHDTVLTPFMGVGSEVYSAVRNGRKGVGIELKESYFKQAVLNVQSARTEHANEQAPLFAEAEGADGDQDYIEVKNTGTKAPHTWKSKKRRAEETERDTGRSLVNE